MKIISSGIVNNYILDKYGKRGNNKKFGVPTLSLPFEIIDAPKDTKSFVVVFDDPDSVKVCNKIWLHWVIANLHRTKVEENESLSAYDFLQGRTDFNDNCYGGPCPPDKPHKYRLTAYALNQDLNLKGNFSYQTLLQQMEGKIIAQATIYGIYNN